MNNFHRRHLHFTVVVPMMVHRQSYIPRSQDRPLKTSGVAEHPKKRLSRAVHAQIYNLRSCYSCLRLTEQSCSSTEVRRQPTDKTRHAPRRGHRVARVAATKPGVGYRYRHEWLPQPEETRRRDVPRKEREKKDWEEGAGSSHT